MKIPLSYQRTEYDCGPTSILNAISFLFAREDIPPDILRYVATYTLDCYGDSGEACKSGTSQMAMMFLSNWLNQYAKAKKLPISCEYVSGERVRVSEHSEIAGALQQGGAAVVRLIYGCWHYVTLTGVTRDAAEMFDPYYRAHPFKRGDIKLIKDKPRAANRKVKFDAFSRPGKSPYSLGPEKTREAIIIFNTKTRITPENTIEYFL
jgi:hypothetical protein